MTGDLSRIALFLSGGTPPQESSLQQHHSKKERAVVALINPGKYEVNFNQEYLMAKLYSLDIVMGLFIAFWVSIVGVCALWVFIKHMNKKKEKLLKEEAALREKLVHCAFNEFHELCRMIHEDSHVFKRPMDMVKKMYYPRLADVMVVMGTRKDLLKKEYKYLIPDYEFYKAEVNKE